MKIDRGWCDLWTGILVDQPTSDVNEKHYLDVVAESETVIDLSKWLRSNRHLNVRIPRATFGVADLCRCSFVSDRELQHWT